MSNRNKPSVLLGLTADGTPVFQTKGKDHRLVIASSGAGKSRNITTLNPAIQKQLARAIQVRSSTFPVIDDMGVFDDDQ